MSEAIRGVWCANLTPLDARGNVSHDLILAHARWVLASGVDGLAPFGTTGEGQSFSSRERRAGLEALLHGGIAASRLLPGTGCAAIVDTIDLTRHALEAGCRQVLVLPPFYIKGVSDEGLYASYARVIDEVGDSRLRLYLYHIPQMSGIAISQGLIERLATAYPGIVVGVKDSGADLAHSLALIARFPNLHVLVGYESHLPEALASGGAGTIGGFANVMPQVMRQLHDAKTSGEAQSSLATIDRVRKALEPFSRMPALKALTADWTADVRWQSVRAPLTPLDPEAQALLQKRWAEADVPVTNRVAA